MLSIYIFLVVLKMCFRLWFFFCVNFESQKIYEAESCYNDSVTIQGHKVELKQKNKKKIQCET